MLNGMNSSGMRRPASDSEMPFISANFCEPVAQIWPVSGRLLTSAFIKIGNVGLLILSALYLNVR